MSARPGGRHYALYLEALEHLAANPSAEVVVAAYSRARAPVMLGEIAELARYRRDDIEVRAGFREIRHANGGRLRVFAPDDLRDGLRPTLEL